MKGTLLALLLVVGAVAALAFRPPPLSPQHWEYYVYVPSNTAPELNRLGAVGWELVQVLPNGPTSTEWIFKRPAP
jgi:hypothetical protein